MANRPANIGRRKHRLSRRASEKILHGHRQSDGVTAGVALNALRFGRCSRSVKEVTGFRALQPNRRDLSSQILATQARVVLIAFRDPTDFFDAAIADQHMGRRSFEDQPLHRPDALARLSFHRANPRRR
jgi:hypothetical protein